MEIPVFLLIFFLGLATGSFLNCVIYRLEEGQSFLRRRSFCPHCRQILSWPDLIPLVSFLILRGRCRYCQKLISWQYPLVELVTGAIFFLITSNQGDRLNLTELTFNLIIASFLIVIFVYDLKHYIIPDRVVYPAILVSGIWYLVSSIVFDSYTKYYILNTLFSAFGAALFFGLIVLASRGKWMGAGDIKLAFLMGLILGWPNILVALFLAFFSGAIIGIGLILAGRKKMKSEVPFGPFLVAGTFSALFWGRDIASWYLNLILLK